VRDCKIYASLKGELSEKHRAFLESQGLFMEEEGDRTVLLFSDEKIIGCGSLCGNVLKYIAVDPAFQGQGESTSLITELVNEAFLMGRSHLFLYTKPEKVRQFQALGFYPVTQTERMAMLENRRGGFERYLASLKQGRGRQGAVIMHASPFTLGHRYLLEEALKEVDSLHVFVVSEAGLSPFSPALRKKMVEAGTRDLPGLILQDCGPYLLSRASFPTYFIKEKEHREIAQAELDLALFCEAVAPKLNIRIRFVGTEPFCPVTRRYNALLLERLPRAGIEVRQIERKDGISASKVRKAMEDGDWDTVKILVPEEVYGILGSQS